MGEKYLGQLTAKSAPATGDILMLEDSEDTKKIDYDALANAILNKLTTKTYTVAGGTNTLIAAIDALNSNAYLLNGATLVPSGSDLNTYTTAGNYQIKFTSDANTISNMPVKTAGVLKVEISGYASNNYKRQTFYEFNNSNRHIRCTNDNGNTWSTWEQAPTRSEINTLNSNRGVTTDANTATLEGTYRTTINPNTTNVPETGEFVLEVHVSGTFVYQFLHTPSCTYFRRKNSAGWNDWIKQPAQTVVAGSNAITTTHTISSAVVLKIGRLVVANVDITATSDIAAWSNFFTIKNTNLASNVYGHLYTDGHTESALCSQYGQVQGSRAISNGSHALVTLVAVLSS